MKEIYFDNSATSFPKPASVVGSLAEFNRRYGASAGRGAYRRAVATGEILSGCRSALADMFHVSDPRRIVFTLNASDALNLAIHGLPWRPGDRALVSPFEHNSVLRPLHELRDRLDIGIDVMPTDPDGRVITDKIKALIRSRTRLVACVHVSNVTGVIQPVEEVGRIVRPFGITYLVDAAQSVGALPVDAVKMRADLLAFPGHKGLLGPLGTGGLYMRPGLDLNPLREGGTGSSSEQERQPDFLPDRYEPGSHNAPGLLGLLRGVQYIQKRGVKNVRAHELELLGEFLEGVKKIPRLRRHGPRRAKDMAAVVSFSFERWKPLEAAQRLWKKHGLMVRAGLHCAPWAHRTIGTFPVGTVRFSFGPFNTREQIRHALKALRAVA